MEDLNAHISKLRYDQESYIILRFTLSTLLKKCSMMEKRGNQMNRRGPPYHFFFLLAEKIIVPLSPITKFVPKSSSQLRAITEKFLVEILQEILDMLMNKYSAKDIK